MAMAEQFTPGLVHNQASQQADAIFVAVAMLAAAQKLAPMGYEVGKRAWRAMFGNRAEEEQILAQVDWVQTTPSSEGTTQFAFENFVETRRRLDENFEEHAAQPATASASASTPAFGQPGYVAKEVQKHDDQMYHKIVLASVQMGKHQEATQQHDPMQTNDAWCIDEKGKVTGTGGDKQRYNSTITRRNKYI